MNRIIKRLYLAWLILFSKRDIIALAYNKKKCEVFLTVGRDELEVMIGVMQRSVDSDRQDEAVETVKRLLCLN